MKTTIATICIFLFLLSTFLTFYQIGGSGGPFKGGYVMMASYYMSAFGDRPASFITADEKKRGSYAASILVQDARSMRFFKSRLGSDRIQSYGQNAWVVKSVPMRDFFGYLRGMEIGIFATGSVMVLTLLLPFYYDSRRP